MSPQALAKAIDELISLTDARYARNISSVNRDLYNQLTIILKELEVDRDGYILQNTANRKILQSANFKIEEVFSSPAYVGAVSNYVQSITKVDVLNTKYFTALDDGFKANRIFIKNLQNEAIAQVESFVLRDGLASQVISPLKNILNTNINSGGQFSGFLQQIRTFVLGNEEVESRALSYSRTHLSDTLLNYARAYQESVTNDLALDWYSYNGPIGDKTREFCEVRAGKYFHRSEIESWAALDWSGKKNGTTASSIFIFAGGWNCRHFIIPVSESAVAKEDLDRIN